MVWFTVNSPCFTFEIWECCGCSHFFEINNMCWLNMQGPKWACFASWVYVTGNHNRNILGPHKFTINANTKWWLRISEFLYILISNTILSYISCNYSWISCTKKNSESGRFTTTWNKGAWKETAKKEGNFFPGLSFSLFFFCIKKNSIWKQKSQKGWSCCNKW